MKTLFFFALLANIIFFLWEFNSGALNSQQGKKIPRNNTTKQILLLSELAKNDQGKSLKIAKNNHYFNKRIASPELKKPTVIKSQTEAEIKAADLTAVTGRDVSVSVKDTPDLNDKVLRNTVEKEAIKASPGSLNGKEANKKQPKSLKSYCYDIGPFQDQNELDEWRELNEFKATSYRQINKEGQVISGYLVYYPAAENYDASMENVRILKRMGVADVWLFKEGELKGAISIGLFSNEKSALLMHEKLVNMGLDVKIMQRYKTGPVLYVQISTQDDTFKDTTVITEKQELSKCEK